MHLLASITVLFASVLSPSRTWYAPESPIEVKVAAEGEARLVATSFAGETIETKDPVEVKGEQTVDLLKSFPAMAQPGTYLLYVVGKDKKLPEFQGTPLVVSVREDKRRGAKPGPMVVKVEPLQYAVFHTKHGPITWTFYYDAAPNTSSFMLKLAAEGYFDKLTFHRIVKGFVVQGGDPRGDGSGGPGFEIDAEFSDRPHERGVLSMARRGDPMEPTGAMPRCEFANSAGSQFFICLDYARTRALDSRYTAFGRVTPESMKAVDAIAAVAVGEGDRPTEPQVIDKVEVKPVTAADNPYLKLKPAADGK